jgi:DNA recombination protein RmuC
MSILIFLFGVIFGVSTFFFKYISMLKDSAIKTQKIKDLINEVENQKEMGNNLKKEFESIASKVLEEKNMKIINLNKVSLENIISPFRTKIDEFKTKIENLQLYESEKISLLKIELEKLINLNKRISEEANNLTNALKTNNKFQGIWGEANLEKILEHAGMVKGINYTSQKKFKNDNNENKIPDYVINLPGKKHIVIDVKTSLLSYVKYHNSKTEIDKKNYSKEHSISLKKHIDELVEVDYTNLCNLNQPEYILMFVPIENAVTLALINKPDLLAYAFKKNIVIVTPSTFLATLKIIEYIWRQEYQKNNVYEISKQGGNLYDKFVNFIQTLTDVDKKISEAKDKIQMAIKKLSSSEKKGDSLVERAQKLKELGSPTKKEIPKEILKMMESEIQNEK